MCGIVAATASREVSEILMEGLRRLEYRGYDSAGLALISHSAALQMHRRPGKVQELEHALRQNPIAGFNGIAHTRWATHGEPTELNAHPHISGGRVAVVHNGIIENHGKLRDELKSQGYRFYSDTDTEVIAHLLHYNLEKHEKSLSEALRAVVQDLDGAFALAAIDIAHPNQIVASRRDSPLVIGVGIGEYFIASDQLALRQVTDRFIYLEENDTVLVTPDFLEVRDASEEVVQRKISQITSAPDENMLGSYSHFMQKEIFEQPQALRATLNQANDPENLGLFGLDTEKAFDEVKAIQIVACGTSYHAGLVARYWLEELAGIPCQVEIASEFRYRKRVTQPSTLLITVSQSGETADTLAALRGIRPGEFIASLAISNVDNSTLVRESDLAFLTKAGTEVGVASTKAFTTQLASFLSVTLALGRRNGMKEDKEKEILSALDALPDAVSSVLKMDSQIRHLSAQFTRRNNVLFLGRGVYYPVAMEGALKLKEISYIHAEAYAAGELKHGPLALVDEDMPVVAIAPGDQLIEKLRSNLEEVRARGGQLSVFADPNSGLESSSDLSVLMMPNCGEFIKPIVYTVALQLLAYYVALNKGTDVDKPRNLAKSVTVE